MNTNTNNNYQNNENNIFVTGDNNGKIHNGDVEVNKHSENKTFVNITYPKRELDNF